MSRVLVLCLISGLASAESLSEAESLYGDGDLSAALKMADVVLKRTTDARETARLQSLRGLVLLAQGKKDKARSAFALALQSDPTAQLDAQRDPPAAVALLEEARALVPPGSIVASSTLHLPTLRIDGIDFGPLPLTTKVAVGRHVLEATGADGLARRAEVLVKSGETVTVQLDLAVKEEERPAAAPQLVPSEPTINEPPRSATLLDQPAPPAKMTWWGLIPIVAAAGAGWVAPILFANEGVAGIGAAASLATIGVLGLGVGMLVHSAVRADAVKSGAPQMTWWGLIPLGIGVAALIATLAVVPWINPSVSDLAPGVFLGAPALIGLGVGGGMLIGQALAVAPSGPRVSVFALPQGGGVSVVGRF